MKKIFFAIFAFIFILGGLFVYERVSFFQFHKPFHEPKNITYSDKQGLGKKIVTVAKECKQEDSVYVLELVKVDDNKTIGRCGGSFSLSAKYYSFIQ